MKSKILVYLLVLTLILTMVTGCETKPKVPANGDEVTSEPVKDSVIVALTGDVATLDPLRYSSGEEFQVMMNIYNALVEKDESGSFVPSLAESWTVSDDGLSYIFKLKKGVKFHNGEELKASDVVFTLTSAKKSPYIESLVEPVKDAVVIDDYTVEFNLNYQYAPFLLTIICDFGIVNEKAYTEAGDNFGQKPIGTGPYKFVKHDVAQRVVLERWDDYFKGKAPIKNLEYKVISDENTTLVALEAGEIDFALRIPFISIQSVENNPALATHKVETITLNFVLMNNKIKPFDNVLVRQAINYAIDKNAVIQIVAEGMGKVTQSIFGDLTFGHSDNIKGYEYNPEKAKELLTKAGYPNGFEVKFKIDSTQSKDAEIIQEFLRKVGVTVKIEQGEANAVIEDLMSGNYEMSTTGIGLTADADSWIDVFASNGQFNLSKYKNTEVDNLFVQGRKATDKNERLAIYERIAQIISDDAAFVPLFNKTNVYVGKKNLKIGHIESTGILKIADMYWEK